MCEAGAGGPGPWAARLEHENGSCRAEGNKLAVADVLEFDGAAAGITIETASDSNNGGGAHGEKKAFVDACKNSFCVC